MIPPCQCTEDGFCHRYNRTMRGRMREICAGINIDLGTAAAFRAQWMREAGASQIGNLGKLIPLLLKTDQAPGDAVAMTAAIYSLHRAHPRRYITAVESPYPEVFAHNPDVVGSIHVPGAMPLHMHYPAIHQSNERGIHFMQGWCEHLGNALGVNVPLLTNRPHLYFTDPTPPVEDYWLICSGGKQDFTNKLWGQRNYQEVVNRLQGSVKFVQVGDNIRHHPKLRGVDDMVGLTSLRGLFDLARQARGVLCGVSLLMHVAAALERPAIIIAGGREPVQWNSYPLQHYVHTVGSLPCRSTQGRAGVACWRGRVLPLGDVASLDRDLCERPIVTGGSTIPECMHMISPAHIVDLILRYHHAGIQKASAR